MGNDSKSLQRGKKEWTENFSKHTKVGRGARQEPRQEEKKAEVLWNHQTERGVRWWLCLAKCYRG